MFKSQEILNSYNFARQSDVVFSEILTKTQFQTLNLENTGMKRFLTKRKAPLSIKKVGL